MELKLTTLEFGEEREHRKAIIAAVDETFTDVGRRLGIIHDKKLYREHGKFEDYCLKFFKMSKQHAYRLMEIAGVRESLSSKSNTRVTSGRAMTALAEVPEAERDAVVAEASKSGPVTAPAIKAAAEKIATPPKNEAEEPAVTVIKDDKGFTIPENLHELWQRATSESQVHIRALHTVKMAVQHGIENKTKDKVFARFHNTDLADFERVLYKIKNSVAPFMVCYNCHGIANKIKDCRTCYHTGYITKDQWGNGSIPEETKAMIEKQAKRK